MVNKRIWVRSILEMALTICMYMGQREEGEMIIIIKVKIAYSALTHDSRMYANEYITSIELIS